MRRGKLMITLITLFCLLLSCAAFYCEPTEEISGQLPISFFIRNVDVEERLACWEDGECNVYVFLPGYAKLNYLYVSISQHASVYIDGSELKDGKSCAEFRLNHTYELRIQTEEKSVEKSIVFLQSENLPTVNIDVASGSMDYIHMDQSNRESGEMRIYSPEGGRLHSIGILSIKGRGNSSWDAEKKPYSIVLEEPEDLLGMGQATNWILLADAYNALHIRNKIVYACSDAIGMPYTPQTVWVDLYLNGEYAGVYLLAERNEVHPERVNISESGSFLVSLELKDKLTKEKIPHILMESGQALRIHYSSDTAVQLQQTFQAVENAIMADNGIDPVSGKSWEELIDLDSWARKYLIEEVFANNDGGALSQYFYRDGSDPDGKIYAGPVWDYDFSMGGENFWLKYRTDYYTVNREYKNGGAYMPWFYHLYRKDAFQARVRELYKEEFLPILDTLLDHTIRDYAGYLDQASAVNGIRWNWTQEEIAEEADYLCWFLGKRSEFLTDLWINGSKYHTVRADPGKYGIAYYAVKSGGSLPKLPDCGETGGIGWYHVETEEPYDITQPVFEDAAIYMKKPQKQISGIHYAGIAVLLLLLLALMAVEIHRISRKTEKLHDMHISK